MQQCQKCSEPFTWKSIIKSIMFGYKPIKCSSCNSKHYVTFMTRIGLSIFAMVFPLVLAYVRMFTIVTINILNVFCGYLLWFILITLVMPFFAGYHIQEARKDNKNQR